MHVPDRRGRITLLSDFGTADGYAAAMRGVIASLAPGVEISDATHAIGQGDIRGGAAALSRYWDLFPSGTIHVAVVDPGVGSGRRGLVVAAAGRCGVGPDNGLLEPMLAQAESVREIRNADLWRHPVSSTFHGRDVFAPVAAYLAGGGLFPQVGPVLDDPIRLAAATPSVEGQDLVGVVTHVDRFGNLVTSIPAARLSPGAVIQVAGQAVGPLHATYSDVDSGALVALAGSTGFLEIAVRDASAASRLAAGRGTEVRIRLAPAP